MPRSFDPNTGQRIPKPVGPPGPNAGKPRSMPAARAGSPAIVRQNEVAEAQPTAAPRQAPSQTQAVPPQEFTARPMAAPPVETKRETVDPTTGAKTVEEAPAETGGLQRPEGPEAKQQDQMLKQGTSMAPSEASEPAPPEKKSPLGMDSPLEKFLGDEKVSSSIPLGAKHHMRSVAIPDQNMSPEERKRYEQQTIRTFQKFGRYHGDDDPNAPAPPIRPGKINYNPLTGRIIMPEGQIDRVTPVLERFRERGGV